MIQIFTSLNALRSQQLNQNQRVFLVCGAWKDTSDRFAVMMQTGDDLNLNKSFSCYDKAEQYYINTVYVLKADNVPFEKEINNGN